MTATDTPQTNGSRRQTWTIGDVLRWTTDRFSEVDGLGSPRLDAEVLLANSLGVERIRLYVDYAKPLSAAELTDYRGSVRRRLDGEPVARITGKREFWSLRLEIDRSVLVPRPETELLVEKALEWLGLRALEAPTVVDVGTGSGAIAVSLAHELPRLRLVALDVSSDSLRVARRNASRHTPGVHFAQADLLTPLPPRSVDLVVSNLPYIPTTQIDRLAPDVAQFDPRTALDGGADGLDLFRRLIPQAASSLREGGGVLLEIGSEQARAVRDLMALAGFSRLRVDRDLAGLDRVVFGEKCARDQQV